MAARIRRSLASDVDQRLLGPTLAPVLPTSVHRSGRHPPPVLLWSRRSRFRHVPFLGGAALLRRDVHPHRQAGVVAITRWVYHVCTRGVGRDCVQAVDGTQGGGFRRADLDGHLVVRVGDHVRGRIREGGRVWTVQLYRAGTSGKREERHRETGNPFGRELACAVKLIPGTKFHLR